MLAREVYQKFLANTLKDIDPRRARTLIELSEALMKKADLSLTSLGRHLSGKTAVKHKIKRVDNFLGNSHVYQDTPQIYGGLCGSLLNSMQEVWIAVDWSGCCSDKYYLLRASVLYKGRSIPIYNEVHASKLCGNPEIQALFLERLKALVPSGCKRVIIITDAGFSTPWFTKVKSLGWDYVGRVRGRIHYCLLDVQRWQPIKQLCKDAKRTPHYLGKGYLGKRTLTSCLSHFIIYRGKVKGRKSYKQANKPFYPDKDRQYAQMNRESWVIVTSCEEAKKMTRRIVYLYKKRMQIEQNFRDDKNPRFGMSWRHSRCQNRLRISTLCLISCIATLLLWMIGFAAENKKLHYAFQANTIRKQRVLSFLYLSKEIIYHCTWMIGLADLQQALNLFQCSYLENLYESL